MTQIVMVKWKDAAMSGGWHDKPDSEAISGATVYTVGFVIAEDEHWIKLAQSTSENEDGNLIEIPRAWIESIATLGDLNACSEVQ